MDIIERLEQAVFAAATCIENQAKYEDVVIFMGTTKSGKSSLINYLIENRLIGEKIDAFKPVCLKKADDNSSGPKIGLCPSSETIIPSRWESRKLPGLGIWDLPGFDDNRGVVQDITNAFYVNNLFKTIRSAKIVLLTDINDIATDSVRSFLLLLNAVESLLKNRIRECFPSITLIFSKVPNTLGEKPVDKNLINDILRDQFLSSAALNISEPAKDLVLHFINNNQNIGFFKRAQIGEVNAEIDEGIVDAIRNTNSIQETILKDISPSIADASKVSLLQVREQLSFVRLFLELQNLVGNVIYNKTVTFENLRCNGVSHDQLTQLNQELSAIKNKIADCLATSSICHAKVNCIKTIDPFIEHFINHHNMCKMVKFMKIFDQLLNTNGSTNFCNYLQSTMTNFMSKIEQLLSWVNMQFEAIRAREEAEAQALREKQRQEEEIRQLQAQIEAENRERARLEEEKRERERYEASVRSRRRRRRECVVS